MKQPLAFCFTQILDRNGSIGFSNLVHVLTCHRAVVTVRIPILWVSYSYVIFFEKCVLL